MAYENLNTGKKNNFYLPLPIGGTYQHNYSFYDTRMGVATIKNDKLGSAHHMAQWALFRKKNLCGVVLRKVGMFLQRTIGVRGGLFAACGESGVLL